MHNRGSLGAHTNISAMYSTYVAHTHKYCASYVSLVANLDIHYLSWQTTCMVTTTHAVRLIDTVYPLFWSLSGHSFAHI